MSLTSIRRFIWCSETFEIIIRLRCSLCMRSLLVGVHLSAFPQLALNFATRQCTQSGPLCVYRMFYFLYVAIIHRCVSFEVGLQDTFMMTRWVPRSDRDEVSCCAVMISINLCDPFFFSAIEEKKKMLGIVLFLLLRDRDGKEDQPHGRLPGIFHSELLAILACVLCAYLLFSCSN